MSSSSNSSSKLPGKITILLDDDDATVGRRKEESNKRKSGDGLKDKAPPTKMKFSLGSKPKAAPLKISLGKPQAKKEQPKILQQPKSNSVAAAFNPDEESDEEEMPMEAKMRMRNVGKNTPVPSGPNSFGKSKQGFSQDYKIYERKLMEEIGDPDKPHDQKSDNKPS